MAKQTNGLIKVEKGKLSGYILPALVEKYKKAGWKILDDKADKKDKDKDAK